MQSPLCCATPRDFVTPELRDLAEDAAAEVSAHSPGKVTLALDGNLPFPHGVPLIPHLSHDDGEQLDFAVYHTDAGGTYLPGRTAALSRALLDDPRTGKLFLKPPLARALGLSHPRLRFAGCGAARRDDHLQVRL